METTLLIPGSNQGVFAASHDHLDEMIMLEQAANCRAQAAAHHRSDIATAEGFSRSDTATADGFSRTSDRVYSSARDLLWYINHVGERTQDSLAEIERNNLNRLRDIELRMSDNESKLQKQILKGVIRSTEQHADLKSTILAESNKSREQMVEYRMRDLEAKIAGLQQDLKK